MAIQTQSRVKFMILCLATTTLAGVPAARAAPAPTGTSVTGVEEVVVTARRRVERLQDVPVAVTAVSGAELQKRGLSSVEQLVQAVPSMQVTSNQGKDQLSITLRGIGIANQYNANTASPVAVYSDEVYQGFRPAPGVQQFDLTRIEVLRGPQGTLFGRNTTGGAINFISVRPSLDGPTTGYAAVGYGNYNHILAEGAVGATLVPDKLGIRVSGQHMSDDGFIHDLNGEPDGGADNSYAGRIQLRMKPTKTIDATLKVYGSTSRGTLPTGITFGVGPGGTNAFGYSRAGLANDQVQTDFPGPQRAQTYGVGLNVAVDVGDVIVTSVSQYDHGHQFVQFDCDGSPFQLCQSRYNISGEELSHDLRVNYSSGKLDAVLGVYYGWDRLFYDSFVGFADAIFLRNRFDQDRGSAAVYTEETYKLDDGVSFTGGVRYTSDTNRFYNDQSELLDSFAGTPFLTTIPTQVGPFDPNAYYPAIVKDSSGVTGRSIAQYKFGQNMIYGSVSFGYRSGSFNGAQFFSPAEINFVPPETVTTYEAGFKGSPISNVTIDTAVYYNQLHNQQVLSNATVQGAVEPNLASVSGISYGFELEAAWQVTDALRLNGSLGLIKSRYDNNQLVAGIPVGGNEFPFAPDVTALVGFDWKVWARDQQSVTLSSTANYMGHYFYDPANGHGALGATLQNGSEPYWLLDARLTYNTGRYSISAYGRNIGNQFYLPFDSNAEGLGFDYASRGAPRTFGLEVHVAF